ncbi:MAG TPA: hypothetical protein VI300_14355 [Solirubrobacter sp.]
MTRTIRAERFAVGDCDVGAGVGVGVGTAVGVDVGVGTGVAALPGFELHGQGSASQAMPSESASSRSGSSVGPPSATK